MDWIDSKYSQLLQAQLGNFKRVKDNYNFRCPLCGDSQKNKNKTRGWILSGKGNKTHYYCHNCGASMSFGNFLKHMNQLLYTEWVGEKFREKTGGKTHKEAEQEVKSEPVKFTGNPFKSVKKISQLDHTHPARMFIDSRRIPTNVHYKLYYVPKFKEWVNSIIPDKFEDLKYEEARIVIPFYNKEEELIGFQGRALFDNDVKYLTIMLDEDAPKMFGLDTVDVNKKIWLFEGPFDSMFIPNAVASAGGRVDSNLDLTSLNKSNIIVVYDNEPRNREVIENMKRAIENDMAIVIWPDYIIQKDINDMILAGYTPSDLLYIMQENTYKGLLATIELTRWSKT